MAAQPRPDELAQLRTTVAALQADLARLQRRRFPRGLLPLALVALLVALIPLATIAAGPIFTDLNPGSTHNANIQAIADAGITKGCDPGVSYCPNGLVTREEMASFLARTAGLGSNPPVANAKTAQTATSADTATTATSAGDANTVGGYAPSGLVRAAHAGSHGSISPFTTTCTLTNDANTTIVQLTLVAPTAGYILVTGAASVYQTSGAGQRGLQVQARIGTDVSISSVAFPGTTAQTAVTTWVFPVAAGTHTVVLEGCSYLASGAQTIHVNNPQLTALFVPFGPTGAP